jgi:formylglycine-generating enzyme required for sulfatase activity/predicted Ser/Thr protein kinase
MTPFAHALSSFQSGLLTQEELLAETYRLLIVEKTPPSSLLETLRARQSTQPLAEGVYESILNRIAAWPQDPTVLIDPSAAGQGDDSTTAAVGDVLQGRFSLVALIGQGGMGRVFKAIDLRRVEAGATDPHVAIKILTGPFGDFLGSIAALQLEAHKLERLAHPNIVRVIDCDRDGQTVFMTMEYLAGESLQKRLRLAGPAGIDRTAAEAIVLAIANALQYAHDNNIVHGDLKPGNVIVTEQQIVKVIDFGMARFVARPDAARPDAARPQAARSEGDRRPLATPKAVTPPYASPEMIAGSDPKAADDVYALACIAYEVLSGKHPFGRRSEPEARASPPPRPLGLATHQYRALIHALAFDPKERTQTAQQFLTEFTAARRNSHLKRGALIGMTVIVAVVAMLFAVQERHRIQSRQAAGGVIPAPGGEIRDCPTCPLMIVLPPGQFMQGADAGDAASLSFERPRHSVAIHYSLAMSANEVTVGEYREFAELTQRTGSGCNTYDGQWRYQPTASWQAPGFAQSPMHPVACVSWNDANDYAKWLSKKSGHAYRLPSASEWEYAARAGTDLTQPWSANKTDACLQANVADQSAEQRFPGWSVFPCSDGYVNTAPVGSFRANAFGLSDLLGNVFEWVQDCWHADYVGAPADGSARMDGDCKEHELRGGSWFSAPQFVNAAYRNRFEADYRSSSVGFRLVRESGK